MTKNKTIVIALILTAAGMILEAVGSFAFCTANDVGFNLQALSNPVVLIGIAAVVIAVLFTLISKIVSAAHKKTDLWLSLSLEIALTGLLFTLIFMVLFAAYPVLINL